MRTITHSINQNQSYIVNNESVSLSRDKIYLNLTILAKNASGKALYCTPNMFDRIEIRYETWSWQNVRIVPLKECVTTRTACDLALYDTLTMTTSVVTDCLRVYPRRCWHSFQMSLRWRCVKRTRIAPRCSWRLPSRKRFRSFWDWLAGCQEGFVPWEEAWKRLRRCVSQLLLFCWSDITCGRPRRWLSRVCPFYQNVSIKTLFWTNLTLKQCATKIWYNRKVVASHMSNKTFCRNSDKLTSQQRLYTGRITFPPLQVVL